MTGTMAPVEAGGSLTMTREEITHDLALVTARLRVRTALEDEVRAQAHAKGAAIGTYTPQTSVLMLREKQLREALTQCDDEATVPHTTAVTYGGC